MTFKTTDPFFLLKGEIKTLLPNLGAHYDHWEELIQTTNTANNDEFSWTQKELLKGINDVNWYCSKLEITIKKVSENPDHYKIDQEELSKRKKISEKKCVEKRKHLTKRSLRHHKLTNNSKTDPTKKKRKIFCIRKFSKKSNFFNEFVLEFLKESKKEIKSIQTKMENTKLLAKVNNDKKKLLLEKSKKQKQDNKYQRLDQAIEMDNQRFINEEFQEYDLIEREQNGELDAIHGTITRVKEMGNVIGEEIDEHNKMFDDLSDDMDAAKGKLKSAMKKSKKLLNSKDRGKMCTIFILIIVLIVLLIIVFQ